MIFHITGIDKRLEMLTKKRVDIIVGDPISIMLAAKNNNIEDQVKIHPYPIYDQQVHFILSPNSKLINNHLIKAFNEALSTKIKKAS